MERSAVFHGDLLFSQIRPPKPRNTTGATLEVRGFAGPDLGFRFEVAAFGLMTGWSDFGFTQIIFAGEGGHFTPTLVAGFTQTRVAGFHTNRFHTNAYCGRGGDVQPARGGGAGLRIWA